MGLGNSTQKPYNDRSKCLDFTKRSPSQHNVSVRLRSNAVTMPDFALGLKLSWLASSVPGSSQSTVQEILEGVVLPMDPAGSGLDSEIFGPVTLVVIVHPSTSWRAFIKAVINHVCFESPKMLLPADGALSPRSTLMSVGLSKVDAGGRPGDFDVWATHANGFEHQYHSTYIHVDFLSQSSNTSPTSRAVPAPSASVIIDHPVCGDAAERVLAHMPGEPSALLVVDPVGAIFMDPKAIRAIAAAIAVLRQCAAARDQHNNYHHRQQEEAISVATPAGGPLLGFYLASSVGGADWAPVVGAFGRVPALLPDDAALARSVCVAILESARFQYNCYLPLFHIFSSRASFCLEAECRSCATVATVAQHLGTGTTAAAASVGGDAGAATASISPDPPQRHLLPGQIETADKLAIFKSDKGGDNSDEDNDQDIEMLAVDDVNPDAASGTWGRGRGPESQSGIARFVRDLFDCSVVPTVPPAVPPADAKALSLLRRSRSLTESSFTVFATTARHPLLPGRSCSSNTIAATTSVPAGVGKGDASTAVPLSGTCSPPPAGDGSVMSAAYTVHGRYVLSAASARGVIGSTANVPDGCLSTTCTGAAAGTSTLQQGLTCRYLHYTAAMASIASSASPCLEGTSSLVTFVVEAARRYAALLEGVGFWAVASNVLEVCLCAAGERWGPRSSRMAALLMQLGRLQHLQGLYRRAEVTLRQALEALESIHGPDGVPVLQCRVALAQVLAVSWEPDAETMLRGALAALDSALGPTARPTLAAREALANFLGRSNRWMEAEVAYQALLQAIEAPAPPPTVTLSPSPVSTGASTAKAGAGAVARQRQGGSVSSPQQRGVTRAPSRASSRKQIFSVNGNGLWPIFGRTEPSNAASGSAATAAEAAAVAAAPKKFDSRSRMAWGFYPDARGCASTAAVGYNGQGVATPSTDVEGRTSAVDATLHRTVLPPLAPAVIVPSAASSTNIPTENALPRLVSAGGADGPMSGGRVTGSAAAADKSPPISPGGDVVVGSGGCHGGVRGLGNEDALAWGRAAAKLAASIAAIQREYNGVNELYHGMHLAGPEGSTGADLAALAAVCPRSGACIAAVVNVRRLTDAGALYDAALSVCRVILDATHPEMVDLQRQYALHLSSAGEHSRAEEVCRSVLEQLMHSPSPLLSHRRHGDSGFSGSRHPSEVGVRQTLGAVLLAAGSLAAATAALTAAVELADRLVASGDMAAADSRRVEALDTLSRVLWQRAQCAQAGGSGSSCTSTSKGGTSSAASTVALSTNPSSISFTMRAIECKHQVLELLIAIYDERHERVLEGWVAVGQMQETVGNLTAAERAYECAAEVALHRHSRLSAATKAIFRHLQRVYQAQGRTADAQVLGHMYRLKGGLLTSAVVPSPATVAVAQA